MATMKANAIYNATHDYLGNFENIKDKVRVFIRNDKALNENEFAIPYIADIWYSFYIPASELDEELTAEIREMNNINHDSIMSFGITKAIVKEWNVSSNELLNIALMNTLKANKVNYLDLNDFMLLFSGHPEKDNINKLKRNQNQHIIVKNENGYRGAVAMLDKRILEDISEFFDGDYYILPSSIHELIITDANNEAEELMAMVKSINNTQVDLKDKLSDHVYRYNAKMHMIEFSA